LFDGVKKSAPSANTWSVLALSCYVQCQLISGENSMKIHYLAAAAIALSSAAFAGTSRAQDTTVRVGGPTDHSQFVGDFAIGFLGFRDILIATAAPGVTAVVAAPVIGGRYWLDAGLGIDAGLGFVLASGSTTQEAGGTSTDTDNPQPAAFILHGGLPLALADSQYFVFELVPELNIGFAGNTLPQAGGDLVLRGFHLDIGARAGAEVHFGFIDIPQLSLQAGIGLSLAFDRTSTEDQATDISTSASTTRLATNVGNNPWDIFSASVAALYYFDD
jgi:hypothetical protein